MVTPSFPARSHVCRRPRRIGGPHSYPDKHVIVVLSGVFPLLLLLSFLCALPPYFPRSNWQVDSLNLAVDMEYEAFEDLEKGGGALRTVKDLSAGAAGGLAQVLLGKLMTGAAI